MHFSGAQAGHYSSGAEYKLHALYAAESPQVPAKAVAAPRLDGLPRQSGQLGGGNWDVATLSNSNFKINN